MNPFQWLLSAASGAMPHFILLGAQKAGTTSFFAALASHPKIRKPYRRELHFFNRNYQRGLGWYRRRFPSVLQLRDGRITGEGSPSYLVHPRVPARLRSDLPAVKLLVVMRDPVDRAISHYFHERRKNREPLPITDAFAAEDERLAPELRRMEEDEFYDSPAFRHFTYRRRGRYLEQIERYLQHFPREQLHLVRSEEFWSEPGDVLDRAYRFLGLDPALAPSAGAWRNRGTYQPAEVPPSVYDELARYYHPFNQQLYDFAGEDWGWRRPG